MSAPAHRASPRGTGSPPAPTPAAPATEPWWAPALDKARAWLDPLIGDTPLQPGAPPAPHVFARARNLQGNPVTVVVGPECPNKDGLRLGENNRHRQAILDAGKRVGIDSRAIAALTDAEAAKVPIYVTMTDKDGKPLLDKKGRPRTQKAGTKWKSDSAASTSGVAGLTQFIPGTWLGMAMKLGTYLNDRCKANGWVFEADVVRTVRGLQEHRPQQQFKLANGNSTHNPSPLPLRDDANVQACLALRNDPTCSIMTAADYAVENLAVIAHAGFKLDGPSDAEKAKLMYLMHHEGGGGGISFLRESCSYTERDLAKQAGVEGAMKWVAAVVAKDAKPTKADGTSNVAKGATATAVQTTKAYRAWFNDYVGLKIALGHFSCNPITDGPTLASIVEKVGGAVIAPLPRPEK